MHESKDASSSEDPHKRSASARVMQLAGNDSKGDARYRPRSAKSRTRRRVLHKLLPFKWQRGVRNLAESIPEDSFSVIWSTLSISAAALIGGTLAYFAEPWLKHEIIQLFHAAAPDARSSQVRTRNQVHLPFRSKAVVLFYTIVTVLRSALKCSVRSALNCSVLGDTTETHTYEWTSVCRS